MNSRLKGVLAVGILAVGGLAAEVGYVRHEGRSAGRAALNRQTQAENDRRRAALQRIAKHPATLRIGVAGYDLPRLENGTLVVPPPIEATCAPDGQNVVCRYTPAAAIPAAPRVPVLLLESAAGESDWASHHRDLRADSFPDGGAYRFTLSGATFRRVQMSQALLDVDGGKTP